MAANKIALGQIDSAIAGGSDTTSDAPIGVNEGLRKILLDANRARPRVKKSRCWPKSAPVTWCPIPKTRAAHQAVHGRSHGIDGKRVGVSRESQDEIAFNSHKTYWLLYDRGFFDDLITPT